MTGDPPHAVFHHRMTHEPGYVMFLREHTPWFQLREPSLLGVRRRDVRELTERCGAPVGTQPGAPTTIRALMARYAEM